MDLKELVLADKKNFTRHPWEVARLHVIHTILKSITLNENLEHKTILDIGCGDGWLLNELAQKYQNSHCVGVDNALNAEVEDGTCAIENKQTNVRFYNDLEVAISCTTSKIFLVLLLDVLEHIEYPSAFLEKLLKSPKIDTDTVFLITVPAYQFLFSSHDVFLGHYRRYDMAAILKTINPIGLHPISKGYFFFTLVIARFFQKLLGSKNHRGVSSWQKKNLFHSFITKILIFDFHIGFYISKIGIRVPGLSNYTVCKKYVS